MFVMNCNVDAGEKLKYPEQKEKNSKKKNKKFRRNEESEETSISEGLSNNPNDLYNPVKCIECNTLVAVYDTDEVYHFFNVLASYS